MDNDLFARELAYQASLAIARGLMRAGLLTNEEHATATTLLLAVYRPPIGALLAEVG